MGDLISRQAAIDAIVNTPTDVYSHDRIVSALDGAAFRQNEIIDIINTLPSTVQEQKGEKMNDPIDRWVVITIVREYLENSMYTKKMLLYDLQNLPPAQSEIIRCKDCKYWKDSDGAYRRGFDAESKCPINLEEVYEGTFYCGMAERRE